jgi:hypothetical protein
MEKEVNNKVKFYRFIGDESDYEHYFFPDTVYSDDYNTPLKVSIRDLARTYPNDWEEVPQATISVNEPVKSFEDRVGKVLDTIEGMLIDKNRKYGDSALNPVRIFSKASPVEQIRVRIDDKLSRVASGQLDDEEDVIDDLIGYLVLLKLSNTK